MGENKITEKSVHDITTDKGVKDKSNDTPTNNPSDKSVKDKPTEKSEKAITKKRNVLKKIDPDAAKVLQNIKDRINKKSYGRKVKDSEIISKGLLLIEPHHLQELQESTLTEKDRLHMAHENFVKQNGKITLDQFIGKLLKGEIRN